MRSVYDDCITSNVAGVEHNDWASLCSSLDLAVGRKFEEVLETWQLPNFYKKTIPPTQRLR